LLKSGTIILFCGIQVRGILW